MLSPLHRHRMPAGGPRGDFLWQFIDVRADGHDLVWFSERLSSPVPVPEPMTTMAAVAARTRRLKFGPSVLITPFRPPAVMAREIAMIDYLSGGRMLPAVGVGVEQDREFRAAGVPFKERARRTDEAIRIMRACWTGQEVSLKGEFWDLDRITVLPRPVQDPIPVWIGGNSEAAMRRAGRLGDGWTPSFITPEQFRVGVDKTHAFAARPARGAADHWHPLLLLPRRRSQGGATAAPSCPATDRRRRPTSAPPRPDSCASGSSTSREAARNSSPADVSLRPSWPARAPGRRGRSDFHAR